MCLFNRLAHFVAFFTTTLLPNHFAHSIRACLRPLLRHHLANLVCPHTLLWHHLAYLVTTGLNPTLWYHLAYLIRPYTLLWYHLAYLVAAGPHTLLRHHLAHFIGAYALLWNHLAYFVTACLDSLLLNHFADFVTLLFDNGLSLIADTVNLLLTNFRNPYFFADCPGWALNLNLLHWPRTVTAFS